MGKAIQKIVVVGCVVVLSILFNSCALTNVQSAKDSQKEAWEMQLTGDTVAKFRILMSRQEVEKGTYAIDGELSGMAQDHMGGGGMMKCSFQGKVAGNVVKVDFLGTGDWGTRVHINGSLQGTLSDVAGKGKYNFTHEYGSSSGDWNARQIKNAQ